MAFIPPIYLYNSIPNDFAPALATASDTPSIAFAPRFDLFGVSSNFIISSSICLCEYTSIPIIFLAIFLFTFSTAFCTPFPIYLVLSPSRNSTASKLPVDAPDGTAAFAFIPFSNSTSTCTVGFPLESNISIAFTFAIFPHLLFTKITSFFYI